MSTSTNPGTQASSYCSTHGGRFQRRGIQRRGPFVGRALLNAAMAWAQWRIQERGRRAQPDPRGAFSALRHPAARTLRGSSTSSTRRGLGHCDASRNAGVGRSPTHGGRFQRRGIQRRGPFVRRALLDAAGAWALRRIQERGRRAQPDPRGAFSASRHPAARALRGSSIARRGGGLGTATHPGTRASGAARPTGGAFSVAASSGEDPSWVEHQLDAAGAWELRRIQESGCRAGARPTGVLISADESGRDVLRGSSTSSTRRILGRRVATPPHH